MIFYIGLSRPNHAEYFDRCCIHIGRLWKRRKPIRGRVLIDSRAFTELRDHGEHRLSALEYGSELRRLHEEGVVPIEAAVAQDYMCEPFMLAKTSLTVADHQRLTIERFDELAGQDLPVPIMPVLQGFDPREYSRHVEAYGDRLTPGMWVGVGSVCKRNGSPVDIVNVFAAIYQVRPDLRLHGFGIKKTALADPGVRGLVFSADSTAWSYNARRNGRDRNDWREAKAYESAVCKIIARPSRGWQIPLPI